jgi:Lrp/AsnC family leucine-responsive transcriptional regulator
VTVELDEIDIRLLNELQADADRPNVELARIVGLSPAATLNRVRRLKERGVIRRISARLDPAQVGFPLQVYVSVILARHEPRASRAFEDTVRSMPQVIAADVVAGEIDVMLLVVARDVAELQRVLTRLSTRGAQRLTTLLRLEEIKPLAPLPVGVTAGRLASLVPSRGGRRRPVAEDQEAGARMTDPQTEDIRPVLEEASRQLAAAAHDAQVAFDCIALGELDRAHTSAVTARTAAEAAVTALQAVLAAGSPDGRQGDRSPADVPSDPDLLPARGRRPADQAVADRLPGGEDAVPPGVVPYLVHLTARHVREPGVQRVEHLADLLLTGGERCHPAVELHDGLGHLEHRVRVGAAVGAGREHAERRAGDLAARPGVHGDADRVEDAHDGQRGGEAGGQVLQLEPDRVVPLGVQGEQLRGQARRRLVVEVAVRHHDAPLQQPLVEPAALLGALQPDARRRNARSRRRRGHWPGR